MLLIQGLHHSSSFETASTKVGARCFHGWTQNVRHVWTLARDM